MLVVHAYIYIYIHTHHTTVQTYIHRSMQRRLNFKECCSLLSGCAFQYKYIFINIYNIYNNIYKYL